MSTQINTSSDPQQQALNLTRLTLYLNTAKGKMEENFGEYPCLGLHFGFGDAEIDRLQKAVVRHGRQDQFDSLTVPVDVLLRTLSFIPNPRDPRMHSPPTPTPSGAAVASTQAKETEAAALRQLAMFRVASTCSTLLFTTMENQCLLGYQGSKKNLPPQEDVARALSAWKEFNLRKQAAAARKREEERIELGRINEQIERDRRMHNLGNYNDPTYEGLPPQQMLFGDIHSEILKQTLLLEKLDDSRCMFENGILSKKKKDAPKKEGGGGWFWGSKK